MPELTIQQMGAIETLEWLFDPNEHRRTGRSLVTAIALIRIALRYPGRSIEIRDHLTRRGPRSAEEISHHISLLLDQDPILRNAFLVHRGRLTLTFNATELAPLEIDASSWLPRGWLSPGPAPTSQGRNLAVVGGHISNIPPPTLNPSPPKPELTLWDYVQDPSF